jgi:hypothetical protein
MATDGESEGRTLRWIRRAKKGFVGNRFQATTGDGNSAPGGDLLMPAKREA